MMIRFTFTKFAFAIGALAIMAVVSLQHMGVAIFDTPPRALLANGVTGGDPLRIAVFGSSQSWGAVLADRFQAYPYRLSPRVDNFAYFAAGPNYPAVCTQSLIGNHAVYDLILLEYYVNGAEHGLAELATRLRTRFPEAIIIVMKFYGPFDALRASAPGMEDWQTLADWKKSMNIPTGNLNELVNAVEKDKGVWRFREHPNSDKAINRVVREIGGYQFHLPKDETPNKTLVNYLRFFDKNMNQLLAERGHAWVADMCGQIVRSHILAKQKPQLQVQRAKVGSWGKGDSCNVWKTSGGMPHEFSSSLVLNQFDTKRGKFALEVRTSGWLDVENEFNEARALYLSFMASDVAGTYPNAVASIDGKSYQLITNAKGKDIHKVGVIRTIPVGIIPAGKVTRVTLTTNMAGASLPFRLVGTTIPNPIVAPMEFNFGPVFNQ